MTRWVAWCWVWALAGLAASGALAQKSATPPLDAPAASESSTQRAQAAFVLQIEAPDDIKTLLEKYLELVRFRALPDLTEAELARLALEAPNNIRELVATLGYFAPEVAVDVQTGGDSGSRSTFSIRVTPGQATRVSEVDISLADAATASPEAQQRREEIADQWSLIPTMQFTQARWDQAKQQALRQLTASRFPAGRIRSSMASIDSARHTAQLRIGLVPGAAYRLGDLAVTGTQHFDADLVTRLARLPAGEDYDQTRLVQAQRRIVDSGYFDAAQVQLDLSGNPQRAPVQIQVTEAPLQKWVLGVGASTDSGARLSAVHTHHRMPGLHWRAVSKLSLDRDTQSIGTELTSQPDANHWQWATSANLQAQTIGTFDVVSQRWRAGRSQGGEFRDQNYYLQYDRAEAGAVELAEPIVVQALSFNYAYTLRHFDSVTFPSSGWGLGLELGGGSTFGVTQDPYSRVLVRAQVYLPLHPANAPSAVALRAGRLALRGQMGAVIAEPDAGIPSTQLFFTGGDTTVRGYSRSEIGHELPGGKVTAGRYLAVASVEWQRPIIANGILTDWEGALFVDAGAVADQPQELTPRYGVGVGARWKSPVGPLQIDLAYGLPRGNVHLHMNVGFIF